MPKPSAKPYTPRREKRHFGYNASSYQVYVARLEGEAAAYYGSPRRNPYPQGFRHQAWTDGFNLADPMGDHHGSNL